MGSFINKKEGLMITSETAIVILEKYPSMEGFNG
jgi:hypothetical protein